MQSLTLETQSLPTDLATWLREFAAAVRNQDFDAGKALFAQDVVSFGTVAIRSTTLDDLVNNQWKQVWVRTAGFDFDYASALAMVEGRQAVILSHWHSTGFDLNGNPFQRQGRSTIVLQSDQSAWKAIHTHFSMNPAQP